METVTAAPPPTRTPKPLPAWIKLRLAAINFVNPSRLANNNIVELPLGKILKLNAPANEVAAMDFVRANTTILAPKSACHAYPSSDPFRQLTPSSPPQSSTSTTSNPTAPPTSS